MNIWQQIAYGNPTGTYNLLLKYGYMPPTDAEGLSLALAHLVAANEDEEILEQVRELHPDREFFQTGKPHSRPGHDHGHNPNRNSHHNCCGVDGYNECAGCGGKCGGSNKQYSMEGPAPAPANIGYQRADIQGILNGNSIQMVAMISLVAITAMVIFSFKKT